MASEGATQWNLVLRGLCFLMVAGGKDAKTMDNMDGITWRTSKDLLDSTGNSAPCRVAAWMGGEFGGAWIHVYAWLSPFAVHLKLSQHF